MAAAAKATGAIGGTIRRAAILAITAAIIAATTILGPVIK
jgi:hypothetical protein